MEFGIFSPLSPSTDVSNGTVVRARATCVCCKAVLPPERVRSQLAAQKGGADVVFDAQGNRTGGARMTAVVTLRTGEKGRHYRLPTDCRLQSGALGAGAGRARSWTSGSGMADPALAPCRTSLLPPIGTLGLLPRPTLWDAPVGRPVHGATEGGTGWIA